MVVTIVIVKVFFFLSLKLYVNSRGGGGGGSPDLGDFLKVYLAFLAKISDKFRRRRVEKRREKLAGFIRSDSRMSGHRDVDDS